MLLIPQLLPSQPPQNELIYTLFRLSLSVYGDLHLASFPFLFYGSTRLVDVLPPLTLIDPCREYRIMPESVVMGSARPRPAPPRAVWDCNKTRRELYIAAADWLPGYHRNIMMLVTDWLVLPQARPGTLARGPERAIRGVRRP